MQKYDMAEKVILYIDGQELQGLVEMGEIVLEQGQIEVPEYMRIRMIANGIEKINAITAKFKITRGSNTYKILKDWYFNKEVHTLIKSRVDAHGVEFGKTQLSNVESLKYSEPAVNLASPSFAQMDCIFAPWAVDPV